MGIIFPGMNDDVSLLSTETGEATGFFNRLAISAFMTLLYFLMCSGLLGGRRN